MMRTAGLCLFLLLGCDVEPCQPGQHADTGALGFCAPDPAAPAGGADAGGAASDGNAGESPGGASGEPMDCPSPSEFGDTCATSADCKCDVDYCAVQPGATSGICTKTGCLEDPSICPDGWQCTDLSVFDPNLPSICTPP